MRVLRDIRAFISSRDLLVFAVGIALSNRFQKTLESLIDTLVMPVVSWVTGTRQLASREARVGDVKLAWGKALESVIVLAISVVVMVEVVRWLTTHVKGLKSSSVTWS